MSVYMTANVGTPIIIPGAPKNPDMTVIAITTHSEGMPVFEPISFGAMTFPSIPWNTNVNSMKGITFDGEAMRIISAHGTVPIHGPKIGIMFVIPRTTAMSG